MIELLGLLSGCLTTLSWLPQLRRTWRTRTAGDISGSYLVTFVSGVAGWVVYGVLKADIAVIAANVVTLLLLAVLLGLKYRRPPVEETAQLTV
jgi:MtN3 and saliva related transmembrane protein